MASRYQPGELRRRVATGLAGASVVVGLIAWNVWGLGLVLAVVSLVVLLEFYQMAGVRLNQPAVWLFFVQGVYLWAGGVYQAGLVPVGGGSGLFSFTGFTLVLVGSVVGALLYSGFVARRGIEFYQIGALAFGIPYTVAPFVLLFLAASRYHMPHGQSHWVLALGVIMQIWAADIAAYFGGKTFGRRPLLPSVSPNKTWEGAFCGALGALVLATCWVVMGPSVPFSWYAIAALVAVLSPVGDLVESQLKRSAGLKDSGRLLPGHGGFLDRFDGFLLTLPAVYLYLRLWL
ncbi:MAG: phosphatidate cytidylyltransferase [Bacteroidia bacterium]|nr:phosphatidate cytidylyltransferase [Bacteroidia bacterium]